VPSTQQDLPLYSALKFTTVLLNIGNAYNPSTGEFSAPYNATYFFAASSEDHDSSRSTYMALMVGNTELDRVYTNSNYVYIPASVQGATKMQQGQKAWIKILTSTGYFAGGYTAFSGFLISHTP
jgi:hypothetical protein